MKQMLGAVLAGATVSVGTALHADIVSTTGAVVEIAPPPSSVEAGQLQSNTEIRAFNERKNVELGAEMPVNITQAGVYDELSDLTPDLSVPSGTCVDSYFIHIDAASTFDYQDSSATFSHDILGVIVLDDDLDNSDGALGYSGTTYPGSLYQRGLELDGVDEITLSGDMRTIEIAGHMGTVVDQIRVITEGTTCGSACAGTVEASTYETSPVRGSSELAKHLAYLLLPIGAVIGLGIWRRKR